MRKKVVAAVLTWACVGFNSSLGVQHFLRGEHNHLVLTWEAKAAKIVTMPNAGGDVPLFEVFIPNTHDGTIFWPPTIPDAVPCP